MPTPSPTRCCQADDGVAVDRRAGAADCIRSARIRLAGLATASTDRLDGYPRDPRPSRIVERVAGAGFAAALAVTVLGPALQLASAVTPLGVPHAQWIHLVGITLAALGIALTVWAQLDMGDSWRVGVDADETTDLVQGRVFGWVRNPIYSAMLVFEFGIALLTPNVVTIVGLVLAAAALELQVRRVEEPYLLAKHGATYRNYTGRVGRFIPGVGMIR